MGLTEGNDSCRKLGSFDSRRSLVDSSLAVLRMSRLTNRRELGVTQDRYRKFLDAIVCASGSTVIPILTVTDGTVWRME